MDSNNIEKLESQRHAHSPQPQNKGTTFITTCFNGLNALTGIGILSIPYALSEGGWTSLTALFMICLVCLYTGLLLKRCMDTNPLIKTYPDIGAQAFGRKGRAVISIFMYLELFLLAIEFLILEGDNLHMLFSKFLRPRGILASVVLVATVSWIGAVEGVGFSEKGVLLRCDGLATAISLSTVSYGSMAILGYLMYGDNVMSQVTLNLPTRNTSSKIAVYTTLINPVTKSKPVYKQTRHIMKGAVKDVQPPSDSAYEIDRGPVRALRPLKQVVMNVVPLFCGWGEWACLCDSNFSMLLESIFWNEDESE
ncbi:UNVERIFIED_CONTAM: Amino acid transporter AVT1I [Sesamum calycinum]|uniref:Amino acid transporter AVT1I n=1 Tax=Sesamum calycinum TaxID=2727403 RepID=A0AAW2PQU3_9LAMI